MVVTRGPSSPGVQVQPERGSVSMFLAKASVAMGSGSPRAIFPSPMQALWPWESGALCSSQRLVFWNLALTTEEPWELIPEGKRKDIRDAPVKSHCPWFLYHVPHTVIHLGFTIYSGRDLGGFNPFSGKANSFHPSTRSISKQKTAG